MRRMDLSCARVMDVPRARLPSTALASAFPAHIGIDGYDAGYIYGPEQEQSCLSTIAAMLLVNSPASLRSFVTFTAIYCVAYPAHSRTSKPSVGASYTS